MKTQIGSLISPRVRVTVGVMMAVSIVVAASVDASVIEGVHFEENLIHNGVGMELKGTALLNYMVFIKAYVGAIYLPADIRSWRALEDVPKQLVLEYFHPINADGFRHATRKSIQQNVDESTFRRIETRVDRLNALYRDVKPNDRYSLTYIPGYGTELALNGEGLGVIDGADFARAVFSIWIGPQPIDEEFKDTLLGAR